MTLIERAPTHAEINQTGPSRTSKSGRKPLPIPNAHAPQSTNLFSPFHARHEQYAVSSEKSARLGLKGPSRPEYQNTGLSASKSAAACPTHPSNMRLPIAVVTGKQSALTSTEIARKVFPGSPKNRFTKRAKPTKNG